MSNEPQDQINSSQPSFFAIIPAHVRYCTKIEHGAKLLYGEITALANRHGYSWASNKYFMDAYGISESTVKNWLKSLKDEGFIEVILEKKGFVTHRKISIINTWNSERVQNKSATCQNRHPREPDNEFHGVSKSDCIITQDSNNTSNKTTPKVPKKVEVFFCIKDNTDLDDAQKKYLTEKHTEKEVQDALNFAYDPGTKIKTTIGQAVIWAAVNKPKFLTPADTEFNRKFSEICEDQCHSSAFLLQAFSKEVAIVAKGAQKEPDIVSYDDKSFIPRFKKLLIERCFEGVEEVFNIVNLQFACL